MRNLLTDTIKKFKGKADYLEIRVEEVEGTSISFRGKEIENVSEPWTRGGCVRALYKGGWGFASFNDLSLFAKKVEMAIERAKMVGGKQSFFADTDPVVDRVNVTFKKDPRQISLSSKVNLLKEYHEVIWSVDPKISDAKTYYLDEIKKVYFANSNKTYVEQEFSDIVGAFIAVARKGDLVQFSGFDVGDPIDFGIVENLHEKIKKRVGKAVELLKAKPVKRGNYTVILDPVLTGAFIHEAFGHLSEADFIYENPEFQKIMVLGKKFAANSLNVVDNPTLKDRRGSFLYDDEGVKAEKTYLIKDGRLIGRLHSRETAAKMDEKITGNARASSYSYHPIVRMSNTYVEEGKASFSDMIKDINLGVYACESLGGESDLEMFTFTAKWGYMIRNGQVAELVRDVKLTGNLFVTLKNIEAVGDELKIVKSAAMCDKGGQMVPIADGGPHLRIRDVTIGGK